MASPSEVPEFVPADGRFIIGNEWRTAAGGATYEVIDPGTGQPIALAADAGIQDAVDAVDAADQAARRWAATAPRERGEVLRRTYELMIEHGEDLARLIVLESGKALAEARAEVRYAAEFFRWFSEEACRADGRYSHSPDGRTRILVSLEPVGICLLVTPWNFPAAMAARKIGPALAAGCTVVLKPAMETPLTSLFIAALLREAGAPPGAVNVVSTTRAAATVAAMMADPRVRKLSFTGSTEVGAQLLRQAADSVMRTSMELGGNAPFVVLEDADLDIAVDSAMVAKLRNTGQSCTAANRFYVHESLQQAFVRRYREALASIKVGHGLEPGIDMGAMIHRRARDRVVALAQDAIDRGARIVTDPPEPTTPTAFLSPVLLADVPPDAECVTSEIFGPLAPIQTFESLDDLLQRANDTESGLVAFVQSRDLRSALAVADALQTGMVGINRGLVSEPAAPFGGWKQSGLGREGAHEGLLEYLETKYVAASW